jgi:hypothetical protein
MYVLGVIGLLGSAVIGADGVQVIGPCIESSSLEFGKTTTVTPNCTSGQNSTWLTLAGGDVSFTAVVNDKPSPCAGSCSFEIPCGTASTINVTSSESTSMLDGD